MLALRGTNYKMGDAAYKKRHRELGLCVYCSYPVYPGCLLCLKHLSNHQKACKKWYAKNREKMQKDAHKRREEWRKNGLCVKCSGVLDPDIDAGLLCCQNCREQIVYEV